MLKSTSFFFWLGIRAVSAQPHEIAFGETRTFPLPTKTEKCILVSSDRHNRPTLAAWSGDRREILLATFNSRLTSVEYDLKRTAIEFDELYSADFNRDGSPDLMCVNKQQKTISFIFDLSSDSLRVSGTVKIPIEPEFILIGDYNNDKNLDVLVYTRKTQGVLPLIGNGKGRFLPGEVIAPDNAVGAIDFAHVNNDNLIDLVLWEWLKSELLVFYGVGKGRFIDQSVFPLQREVGALVATSMVRGHSLDLVLKMTDSSEFQIWEGNDFGDFQFKYRIPFSGQVTDFAFADVNNDGLNDAVLSVNPASLQVVFNNDVDAFSDRIEYASGYAPQNVFVLSKRQDKSKDCIVYDREGGQFITYKNAMKSSAIKDSVRMVTGIHPSEILAGDFNRDGVSDIALISKKSKSVSLYYGRKAAVPSGPFSYSITEEPTHFTFHATTDSTIQFVLSFQQSHQISYFTLNTASHSISNAFIGSEGDAQFLATTFNYHHQAEFVTFNSTVSDGSSLSFYEQLGPITFIERTFRLLPPDSLLGACVADLNGNRFFDLVYIYRTGDTSTVELGVAFGDSSYSMKQRIISREIELPDIKRMFIYLADFNKDNILDLLMQTGPPPECLMIAKGKGEGQFSDPKIIASGVPVDERSDVQIIDMDNDGLIDIIIGSRRFGQVLWLRNQSDGNFDDVQVLFKDAELSHYVVVDIDGDKANDIAMTMDKKGFLKIVQGKRLPFRMGQIFDE